MNSQQIKEKIVQDVVNSFIENKIERKDADKLWLEITDMIGKVMRSKGQWKN